MGQRAGLIGWIVGLSVAIAIAGPAPALTLQEAIGQARRNLPALQAARHRVESADLQHRATGGAYLPSLDLTALHDRHRGELGEYGATGFDVTLSYRLFDGRRQANRTIARIGVETEREELRKQQIELDYQVKVAFHAAIAGREILEQRRIQQQDARKDLEVAEGRRSLGAARLSEVLQASVRLEQARFNVVQAEGEHRKALLELNSLVGRPEEAADDLQGTLDSGRAIPELAPLVQAVLRRPEIRQAELARERAEGGRAIARSEFYPLVSLNLSYSRSDTGSLGRETFEDRSTGVRATWNLFELGKFYRERAARAEISVSAEALREQERRLLLDCRRAWQDLVTAARNESVAVEQLRRAEQNYEQAFGEYKVGKGDILSLVQAESLQANAQVQLTAARLDAVLARARLERITGEMR